MRLSIVDAWEVRVAVGVTPTGKGVIPDDDPLAVGVIGCYPPITVWDSADVST
jgi:thiamine pyrophosphate-dependent acetolactate synthase large subunit-like protein